MPYIQYKNAYGDPYGKITVIDEVDRNNYPNVAWIDEYSLDYIMNYVPPRNRSKQFYLIDINGELKQLLLCRDKYLEMVNNNPRMVIDVLEAPPQEYGDEINSPGEMLTKKGYLQYIPYTLEYILYRTMPGVLSEIPLGSKLTVEDNYCHTQTQRILVKKPNWFDINEAKIHLNNLVKNESLKLDNYILQNYMQDDIGNIVLEGLMTDYQNRLNENEEQFVFDDFSFEDYIDENELDSLWLRNPNSYDVYEFEIDILNQVPPKNASIV